jgi:hypothetical protein
MVITTATTPAVAVKMKLVGGDTDTASALHRLATAVSSQADTPERGKYYEAKTEETKERTGENKAKARTS